ncbi:ThuA domain-containing protein [Mycetocola tolaasinivorans]|uniref:ThuA domain-containing protein n=1 Tax=Mycetocola tolaasinivorans TaxID=76635 RepID=A0A3L7AB35_9MICO|nr:ThuA domain-containing protein [Mycetocola tolaasinivorans]RLP77427.1 ThuA domain-containing protein [Mycetocola tolaasinivorans]
MAKITILTGSGQYQDRWHDFTATGYRVAQVLQEAGHEVVLRALKPQGILEELEDTDLLVVNSGFGEYTEVSDGPREEWDEAFAALRAYRARKAPILALHAASNSLDGLEEWHQWIGGEWVRGTSMHPPIGVSHVQVSDADHPITEGFADFHPYDEMYSYLEAYPGSRVLLTHDYADLTHALVWTTEQDGARTVYDALGHGVQAFDTPERHDLLRREVDWLLAR